MYILGEHSKKKQPKITLLIIRLKKTLEQLQTNLKKLPKAFSMVLKMVKIGQLPYHRAETTSKNLDFCECISIFLVLNTIRKYGP